jgi:signal transduction histidine kinase
MIPINPSVSKDDAGNLGLADLIDVPTVQLLANDFYQLSQIPLFIEDLNGNPLVSAGGQDICKHFHRAHPDTCKNCAESDLVLSEGVAPGTFKIYKCKNNMFDVVTPITMNGKHIGNLFSGQFFFVGEPLDYELFRSQAKQHGFNETAYIAALERAPQLNRETVAKGMAFFVKFAEVLSRLSFRGMKLAQSMAEVSEVNIKLAESVKELEAFNHSVSHDLRSPLRHIREFSKILTIDFGFSLPPEAQRHLQKIEESAQRMLLMVEDLLRLSQIGYCELSLRVTDLRSMVDKVIVGLQSESENRQIDWNIGALPHVECDPGLMKQVFENLLSNALKFTRPRPRAVIEIGQREQNGAPVIYVRDNGVGFGMKHARNLFGVFQRLHSAEDFEGTGVGLATVQRIIRRHGGFVWAEAELEKGATFYFTLGTSDTSAAPMAKQCRSV